MKQQKIRRKHRRIKSKIINAITYIAAIAMFIFIIYYGLGGYTPFLVGAVVCWLWCMLYAWANNIFAPVRRK